MAGCQQFPKKLFIMTNVSVSFIVIHYSNKNITFKSELFSYLKPTSKNINLVYFYSVLIILIL